MPGRVMTDEQHLYPEAIYALSRKLYEILGACLYPEGTKGTKERPIVVPSLFSRQSRTFHWLAVDVRQWKGSDLSCIRQTVLEEGKVWTEFRTVMTGLGDSRLNYALKHLATGGLKSDEYHRHLLSVYEAYRLPAGLYLDGIIYRNLERRQTKGLESDVCIRYATGQLVDRLSTYQRDPWAEIDVFRDAGYKRLSLQRFQCQETDDPRECETDDVLKIKKPDNAVEPSGIEFQRFMLEKLFLRNVPPRYFVVLPVYDGWIGDEPWGCLWGNLLLLFEKSDERDRFVREPRWRVLMRESRGVAHELSRAAASTILVEPLRKPVDLIEHFVKQIVWLQDWERVIVYRRKGETHEPEYCYKREPNPKLVWSEWKQCESQEGGMSCPDCPSWKKVAEGGGDYLRWDHDLSGPAFMPDLTDQERGLLASVRFAFQYSRAAVVPKDEDRRKTLGEFYIRQQLDVLGGLASKIRARRSALRTAAVAIMGRQMAHNISSHVLATLGTEGELEKVARQEEELSKPVQDGNKHTMMVTFLEYLQERMDFLAELSTTMPFFGLSMWMCRDVIGTFQEQEILLDRISGTAAKARMALRCNGSKISRGWDVCRLDVDLRYSSPAGRVGAQALYVILENVIRNTAKHAPVSGGKGVRIEIDVREPVGLGDDLYEVMVWDTRGNAGEPVGEESKPLVQYLNGVIDEAIIDDNGEVQPRNWGVREMLICAAHLRGIPPEDLEQRLTEPPLLNAVPVDENGHVLEGDGDNGNLGYRFFLRKAEDLVVLGKLEGVDDKALTSNQRSLRGLGIEVISDAAFIDEALKRGLNHAFLIWLNPDETKYKDCRLFLPIRVFVPEGTTGFPRATRLDSAFVHNLGGRLISGQGQHLVRDLWQKWFVHLWQNPGGNGSARASLPELYNRVGKDEQASEKQQACGKRIRDRQPLETPAVIYDRHGGVEKGVRAGGKVVFWEPYRGYEPQSVLFEKPPTDPLSKEILEYQFLEAGLTRVAILDERVQAGVLGTEVPCNEGGRIPLREVLRAMRVFVPDKKKGADMDCDLDKPDPEKIKAWLKSQCIGLDFLVVHQGILDRLREKLKSGPDTERDPGEWIEARSRDADIAHLVVCSGRGIPSGRPRSSRFLPLSSVEKWTVRTKSKYHLCQLLYASRSPR